MQSNPTATILTKTQQKRLYFLMDHCVVVDHEGDRDILSALELSEALYKLNVFTELTQWVHTRRRDLILEAVPLLSFTEKENRSSNLETTRMILPAFIVCTFFFFLTDQCQNFTFYWNAAVMRLENKICPRMVNVLKHKGGRTTGFRPFDMSVWKLLKA